MQFFNPILLKKFESSSTNDKRINDIPILEEEDDIHSFLIKDQWQIWTKLFSKMILLTSYLAEGYWMDPKLLDFDNRRVLIAKKLIFSDPFIFYHHYSIQKRNFCSEIRVF